MSHEPDTWGQDPQVQYMRQVFAALERAHGELLAGMGLEPLDGRLPPARALARGCFERAWPRALKRGLAREPQEAALLYRCCLARGLSRQGLKVPAELLPSEGIYAALAAEVVV